MQRVVVDDSAARAGNRWAMTRRDFLLRELVELYWRSTLCCRPLQQDGAVDVMARLLADEAVPGPLPRLTRLAGFIWPEAPFPHFSVQVRLLRLQAVRLQAALRMASLADHSNQKAVLPEQHELQTILAEADNQLHTVFLAEGGNPLLLRLLLENPELSVTLWHKELDELLAEIFPDARETAYLYAGKSYFNAYRLPEALAAFQQALVINPDLEEARRRSYIVAGMLRDADRL